jgi:hypothetical protein
MPIEFKCVCGGALEVGFLPDFSQASTWVTTWIAGAPDTKKSITETLRTGAGVRAKGEAVFVVEAYRCTSCGRLELYANKPPNPSASPARAD